VLSQAERSDLLLRSASPPESSTTSSPPASGISSSLTAGFLPTVLLAIHEPVTKIGTRVIEGTIVTGYRTAITLADLQRSSRSESRLSGASFENIGSSAGSLPSATTIPIQLAIWIDAMGRVRQTGPYKTHDVVVMCVPIRADAPTPIGRDLT
jgi:hypothetical protein